ncbi:MAG TPA: FtsX-like permease family protein [Candidatus Deferrimicrobium sp.]|nr:FtsX-like permease family protein [Candidatus Deferrimicrobium sp.]
MSKQLELESSKSKKFTPYILTIVIISLGSFLVLNFFLKIYSIMILDNILFCSGLFLIVFGFLILVHIKIKALLIGCTFGILGCLLLFLIIQQNGLTLQIFENALFDLITLMSLFFVGILLISRKVFKITVSLLIILVGIIFITNYMNKFIDFLPESFLFCTLGFVFLALGLYFCIPQIKKIQFLYFGLILTIFGIIELISGFQALIEELSIGTVIQIGETLIGGIFFVTGMVLLGCVILPGIITGLSFVFKPILRFMRSIMARNVLRNARRTQNTFAMVSIGLAFLIMVSTLVGSVSAGVYPGAKLSVGGDMQVGWSGGYVPINFTTPLQQVEHATEVVPMYMIYSNCIIDETTSEYQIRYFVINTTDYASLHASPTLMDIIAPSKLSVDEFIHRLDQENSTILYYELGNELNKGVGDTVTASSNYFANVSLEIVGLCGKMPGMVYSFREYLPPIYVAIISWDTFFKISGYNFTTFNSWVYFVVGLDDLSNDLLVKESFTEILDDYRTVSTYDIYSIRNQVEEYGGLINTVGLVLNQVLIIALLVSLLGLSITMNISIYQRRTEIGVLRAIGVSKKQILQLIFGETLTISLAGILFGSITGIIAAYLVISFFPFIEWLAVLFTISWTTLSIYWSILLGVAIGSSIIPAYNVNKMEIVETIRLRGK